MSIPTSRPPHHKPRHSTSSQNLNLHTPPPPYSYTDPGRASPPSSSSPSSPQLITPHRLRSQILVNNLKASGILSYGHSPHHHHHHADDENKLAHSARGLEAIGFDENRSMYASFKGDEDEEGEWMWVGGRKKESDNSKRRAGRRRGDSTTGGKRGFLKKLVGGRRAEEERERERGKGEKL